MDQTYFMLYAQQCILMHLQNNKNFRPHTHVRYKMYFSSHVSESNSDLVHISVLQSDCTCGFFDNDKKNQQHLLEPHWDIWATAFIIEGNVIMHLKDPQLYVVKEE